MYRFPISSMLLIPLLIAVLSGDVQGEKNRLPKPESESVKRAVKDIREAYAEDYQDAEQGTRNKHKLALKLNAASPLRIQFGKTPENQPANLEKLRINPVFSLYFLALRP